MKKVFFFVLVFVLLSTSAVLAQNEISPEKKARREEMLLNIEKTFPRLLHKDICDAHYSESSGFSDQYNLTTLSWQKGGVWSWNLTSSSPVTEERGLVFFKVPLEFGSYTDFAIHMDMRIAKEYPQGTGGCFLQYSDREIVGYEKSHAVSMMIGRKIDGYTNTAYGKKSFDIMDISEYGEVGRMYKLDIIRLSGVASFFIDGEFIGDYEDNFNSRFTWVAGSILFEGGEEVTCEVDNILIRRK